MVSINNSTELISYKEAILTIPANETRTYENPYNFIRILSSTGTDNALLFRFGASSIETPLTVGLGIRSDEILPNVTIRNITGTAVTLRISETRGDILDDRLTITGDVETRQEPDTVQQVSLETFDSNGEIAVDSSQYRNVLIQNMSATDPIYIFANNTFKVEAGGTFEKNFAGQFTIYGTVGETASVGYFS